MSDTNAPRSKTDLFVSFTLLALQGFGGVLAVVQRELVEKKKWLTQDEFIEDWAVAQILPGPNVVNLSLMLGGATLVCLGHWPHSVVYCWPPRSWCYCWQPPWQALQTRPLPKACCVAWGRLLLA